MKGLSFKPPQKIMERVLLRASAESRCPALAASTSSPSCCCSERRALAKTASKQTARARPPRCSLAAAAVGAKSTSSLSSSPATSGPRYRSILIAVKSARSLSIPLRVSASSEEKGDAGGEPSISPPIALSSSSRSSSSSPSPPGAALAAAAATLGVILFAVTRLSTGKHADSRSIVVRI